MAGRSGRHPRPGGGSAASRGPGEGRGGARGPVDGPGVSRRARRRTPRRPGGLPPAVYFAAAGVVVFVAVIAAVAVVVFGRTDHRTTPPARAANEGGPAPAAYSQAASTAAFRPIADRDADSRPLTAADVFGTKTITDADSKASLKLTASKLDTQCAAAVWGSVLARELQRAGCSQTTRGVYIDKHYAAMVTIFNLADVKAADRIVATIDPRSGKGFPLVPGGTTPFGQAFSTARGVAMGHYAVISWVERTDGTGDEQDTGLLSLLVATGRPKAVLVRAAARPVAQ